MADQTIYELPSREATGSERVPVEADNANYGVTTRSIAALNDEKIAAAQSTADEALANTKTLASVDSELSERIDKAVSNATSSINNLQSAHNTNANAIATLQKSVDNNRADIDTMLKDLGYYGDIAAEELTLEIAESGYAINTSGVKTAMSGYAISKEIALTQGNIYLIKASAVDSKVSMFARKSIETRTDRVSYTYTYNSQGQPLTATADYDSSVVYQFNYTATENEDGTTDNILNNITLNGVEVSELPSTRTYNVEVYNPLFKTGAIATPKSGYYVYFCPTTMSIIVSAKTADLQQSSTDETKGKLYGVRYGVFASIASNYVNRWERDELDERISALEAKHEQDDYNEQSYCVGAWVDDDISPDSVKTYGDEKALMDMYDMVLIDCTDNTGITTTPVATLKRDNLFRTKDGMFAPAVCISATDAADATLALYQKVSGEYVQYCEAGKYDAEDYLENVLRPVVQATPNNLTAAKLYKLVEGEYVEAHAMLPWETTETKYSHGLMNNKTLYLLDNVVGNSGYRWKGVFSYPAVWDGINIADYKLPPTALSLSPFCTIDGKARSFFYLFEGETNCQSDNGAGGVIKVFRNNRTYPRANDISQITAMQMCRANNADTQKAYPCGEGGFHAYNTALNAVEVACGTKYLHKPSRYGSGISSQDACSNESQFLNQGGFRSRVQGTDTWTYTRWEQNPTIYYDANGSTDRASNITSNSYPKEQCEESQMAYSWAMEFGIAENQHFEMYSGEYWYIDNAEALSGYMNARVYKYIADVVDAYTKDGTAAKFDIGIVLRMSLYMGLNLSGDVRRYEGGGYDMIANNNTSSSGGSVSGVPMDVYMEFDQTKWVYDTEYSIKNGLTFKCQSTYRHIAHFLNLADGYVRERIPYTAAKVKNGGNVNTYECAYIWSGKQWGGYSNGLVRVGITLSLYSGASPCSARASHQHYDMSCTNRSYCAFAQWLCLAQR